MQMTDRQLKFWMWGIFGFCFLFHLWGVLQGLHLPAESSKEANTAMTVYWLLHGSPWLAYETPVLGPPWSTPMEFPVFHWIIAIACKIFRTPLEETGRAISVLSFYLSMIPAWHILRNLGVGKNARFAFLAVYLASPVYILFSRGFLLEVFCVGLGLSAIAFGLQFQRKPSWTSGALTAVFASLCALSKAMTFVGIVYGMAAILYGQPSRRRIKSYFPLAFLFLAIPAVTLLGWIHYSNEVKALNPMAGFLNAQAMRTWYLGTLDDRLKIWDFVVQFFFRGSTTDAFGQRAFFLLMLGALFFERTYWKRFLVCIGLYLATAYTFIKLYTAIGHSYYRTASIFYLVACVGFFIQGWIEKKDVRRPIGVFLLVLCVAGCVYQYGRDHLKKQLWTDTALTKFSKKIEAATREGSVLLIFGFDWNPSMAYQANRQSVMTLGGRPLESPEFKASVENLKPYTIGGIAMCNPRGLVFDPVIQTKFNYFGFSTQPDFAADPSIVGQEKYNCFFFSKKS